MLVKKKHNSLDITIWLHGKNTDLKKILGSDIFKIPETAKKGTFHGQYEMFGAGWTVNETMIVLIKTLTIMNVRIQVMDINCMRKR